MKARTKKIIFEGKWLILSELTLTAQNGDTVVWEALERRNINTIVIIAARMRPSGAFVFIRQFRPPMNAFVIGFPAGLAESADIPAEALKELREETGYTGTVVDISPGLAFNASLSREIVHLARVDVDEHDPANKDPQQSLEPEEQIDVVTVAREHIPEFFRAEQEKGNLISASVWYFFADPEAPFAMNKETP